MIETTAAEVSLVEDGIVLIRFREGTSIEPQHADEIARAASRVAGARTTAISWTRASLCT